MDYRWVVEHHLIPEFGEHTSLALIDADRVDEYRERLVAEGRLSARTINKLLINLNGVFRRAGRVYGVRENPVQLVERQPVRTSGDFRVLGPEQIRQLLKAALTGQDAAIFAVAAYSGLRLGELRALSWGDLDIDRRVIRVRRNYTRGHFETPKSGRVRSVPLTDEVIGRLAPLRRRGHHLAADNLVFLGRGGAPVEDSRLRRRFYETLDRAGLPHMRFHDLRHTFGTLAVQVFPLSDVAAYMGHADIQTTMIYVHHIPKADAAARLSEILTKEHPAPPVSQPHAPVGLKHESAGWTPAARG